MRKVSLTAVESNNHFRVYLLATTAGIVSLFPLLINSTGLCWVFLLC